LDRHKKNLSLILDKFYINFFVPNFSHLDGGGVQFETKLLQNLQDKTIRRKKWLLVYGICTQFGFQNSIYLAIHEKNLKKTWEKKIYFRKKIDFFCKDP
jgi:hypothetical protein